MTGMHKRLLNAKMEDHVFTVKYIIRHPMTGMDKRLLNAKMEDHVFTVKYINKAPNDRHG